MTFPPAAAVSRLPVAHYAVGSAVNQATRQIGSVMGVAITIAWLGHAALARGDFDLVAVGRSLIPNPDWPKLIAAGHATEDSLKKIETEVREIVNDSAQFAQDSPEPHPDELWTDVLVESR